MKLDVLNDSQIHPNPQLTIEKTWKMFFSSTKQRPENHIFQVIDTLELDEQCRAQLSDLPRLPSKAEW